MYVYVFVASAHQAILKTNARSMVGVHYVYLIHMIWIFLLPYIAHN